MIAVSFHGSHTVVSGDTLYSIGQTDHGASWQQVWNANKWIKNPDLIYPGWTIKLPDRGEPSRYRASTGAVPRHTSRVHAYAGSGTLSCAGLESLWRAAGGPSWAAFTAAEIAMAESGGRQYATGPAGERGYWQIHPDHGFLSTYNAYGNARAAVIISGGGRNWAPWTTFTSGAYHGRC